VSTAASAIDVSLLPNLLAPLFARRPELAAAYLFGSAARGRAREDSDLDVGLVLRERRASRQAFEVMAADLAVDISCATGVERVDIVDLAAQGPIFALEALCHGVRLYEGDRNRRIDFESETMVRAHDFQPTFDLATRGKIAALRRRLAGR
jgi:uncharacterized protein